jgi:hypothetical protein
LPLVMSYWPLSCPLIAVALLTTVAIFTFSPASVKKPCCCATYSPAVSAAGTAETTRLVFSRLRVRCAVPEPVLHPAASAASPAAASTRLM